MKPVPIMIENEDVRAVRGGTGFAKCGGNYAGAMRASDRAEAKGFSQVLWNIDSRDWVKPGTGTITQDATRVIDTTPVTVLMHASLPETPDGSDAPLTSTVASLRPVIQAYKRMGYEFVQVDGTPFPLRGAATVSAASGASPSR